MSKVFRIVGISGSLRKDSWNTKFLKAFAVAARDKEFVEKGVEFEIADWSKYILQLPRTLTIGSQYTMGIWRLMFLHLCWSLKRQLRLLMALSLLPPNTITRTCL